MEVPKLCSGNYILWTHVTSPLFNSLDYIDFMDKFFRQKKFKSAFFLTSASTFFMNSNFKWISHNEKKKKSLTQDLQKYYLVNNAAFISSRKNYIFDKNRISAEAKATASGKYSEIDIDNKEDLLFLVKNYINIKIKMY